MPNVQNTKKKKTISWKKFFPLHGDHSKYIMDTYMIISDIRWSKNYLFRKSADPLRRPDLRRSAKSVPGYVQ